MLTLTKKARFCCSHRLYNPVLSDEENNRLFGPCARLHGHNYVLEVTVKGTIDAQTGMIMNLTTLDRYINDEIIDWVDHKNLTEDIPQFESVLPTVENMVMIFWDRLEAVLPAGTLHRISLQETEDNRAEYTKE